MCVAPMFSCTWLRLKHRETGSSISERMRATSPSTLPPMTAETSFSGPVTRSRRSARRKPSSATTRISSLPISNRQPVRMGRLSSTAMANSVRPIMSRSTLWGISKEGPETSGSSGYSTGSMPVIVVREDAHRMVA